MRLMRRRFTSGMFFDQRGRHLQSCKWPCERDRHNMKSKVRRKDVQQNATFSSLILLACRPLDFRRLHESASRFQNRC